LAVEASRKPRFFYQHDWDVPMDVTFLDLAKVKMLARGLAARADLEAKTGKGGKAADDLLAARRLGALLGQEPTVISLLVRIAIDAVAMRGYQHCAAFLSHDPTGLQDLAQTLAVKVAPLSFGRALRGEAYLSISCSRNFDGSAREFAILSGATSGSFSTSKGRYLRRTGFPVNEIGRANMACLLELWAKAAPVMKFDDPILIATALERLISQATAHPTGSNMLAAILFPVFDQVGQAIVVDQANVQVSRALIGALAFRAEHGTFPTSLTQVPGKWVDPFTGSQLHLKVKDGEIRIYSVGPDKKDNGGISRTERQAHPNAANGGWDVVAAYPPLPRARPVANANRS
jgi:hypothetical protein